MFFGSNMWWYTSLFTSKTQFYKSTIHNPRVEKDAIQRWLYNDVDDVHIFFSYKRIFTKATCMLKIMLLVDLMYINTIFLAKWHYIIWLALITILLLLLFVSFWCLDALFASMDRCMDCDIWGCSIGFITVDEI